MHKYLSISNELLKRIKNNVYDNKNNRIPNELSLSKEFDCSRMTINRALDLLVQEGIVYRRRGAGSFIRENITNPKFSFNNDELTGLTKSVNNTIRTDVISFKIIFPDETVCNSLIINNTTPVYEILRVRYIDSIPYVVEKTFMNAKIISGITECTLEGSVYSYIENTLNLKINGSKKILRADKSNLLDKQYLLLSDNEPVLEVEQIAYLSTGEAFEYSFSRHRYDKFEFASFSIKN
ncbi:MAG: GntR family transcriptional regulator [Clostridium sp.]|uniref:GntR family transcriptional regulator n=1 Tax=Clostridium sp. TaxID=1506 RepID=UPI003F3B2523